MTIFLSMLNEPDKASALLSGSVLYREGKIGTSTFIVDPREFTKIPGMPFAYWVSNSVRNLFANLPPLEGNGITAKQGLSTADDKRFVRAAWEVDGNQSKKWPLFAKGGTYSPFYSDIHLVVNWDKNGAEIKNGICTRYPYLKGNWEFVAKNTEYYRRPGLTWPRRTQIGLGMRIMPLGCVFADKGPAIFTDENSADDLLSLLAITTSSPFKSLVELQMAFGSYEVGVIQRTPIPPIPSQEVSGLSSLAKSAWSNKRMLDTVQETSHAFLLPEALRTRLGNYHPAKIEAELVRIQAAIDEIGFKLYDFSDEDRAAILHSANCESDDIADTEADDESENVAPPVDRQTALLSWAVGVAFGRFDLGLAIGEREAPPEPLPFDPLPAKSPGMLPDGANPFHHHLGILVDDPGQPHDLVNLVEEILTRIDVAAPHDIRRWLQRDFFGYHLQKYSKSRRKAPIYWPLATISGSYTLWFYYPCLSSQTLYTAINDFLEGPRGKLKQVADDLATLRSKGNSRNRNDENHLESLELLESELIELRDTLLKIAQSYHIDQDDGVQITAAPLWPLFRHKPWQKVLKDTWSKLENGDYDWAHLAMNYWPERVREKCKTDKSLAIAHSLEDLYVEPETKPKKAKSRKSAGSAE